MKTHWRFCAAALTPLLLVQLGCLSTPSLAQSLAESSGSIARGFIDVDGSVVSATPNVSSSWNAQSMRYEIEIAGVDYLLWRYVTVITPSSGGGGVEPVIAYVGSMGGKLLVHFQTPEGQEGVRSRFQFVTYRAGEPAESQAPHDRLDEGTARTVLYGLIRSDGEPLTEPFASPDVISAQRTGTGTYRVQFQQDVWGCSHVATGARDDAASIINTMAGPRFNVAWRDVVFVHTFDADGNPADGAFDITIVCDSPADSPRTMLYGLIRADGEPFGSPDVVSAEHVEAGWYLVGFQQNGHTYPPDVRRCSNVASSTAARDQPQMVTTHAWTDGVVAVRIRDNDGNTADGSFSIAIVCDEPADRSQMVGYGLITADGTTFSSPDVASAQHIGTGEYRVQFQQDVWVCSQVATSTTAREQPQLVTTIAGPRFNSAWEDIVIVVITDADGNPEDGSFHITVVCNEP